MLGFYGVSAPQLSLMRLTRNRRRVLVSLISAGSVSHIRETKEHLIYLEKFFENLTYSYEDPQVRALESKIRRAQRGSASVSVFTGASTATASVDELTLQMENLIKEKGLQRTLTNVFTTIENKKDVLGASAFEVLKVLADIMPSRLEVLKDTLVETPVSERRIFGRSPTAVFLRPAIMEEGFFNILQLGGPKRIPPYEVLRRLRKELDVIEDITLAYFNSKETSFVPVSKDKVKDALAASRFLGYVSSLGLPEEEANLLESKYINLVNPLMSNLKFVTPNVTESEFEELASFFFELVLLDNSPTYINDLLGVNGFSLEEIDRIYEEFNNIGLFYFNRVNVKLFVKSLKSLVIGRDISLAPLDTKSERDGRSFLDVYEDVRKAFLSLVPSGSRREENLSAVIDI